MATATTVDEYIAASTAWPTEMSALRSVLLETGLTETIKWRSPCFLHSGSNIAIMQEMRAHLALMFFKGVMLDDPHGVLEEQGPNSRSAKRVCFSSVDDVDRLAGAVRALVASAIDVEASGRTAPADGDLVLVAELQDRLDADPELAAAFARLTRGRQRHYHLYVSEAKRPATRISRVDKCVPTILAGKGLRDR